LLQGKIKGWEINKIGSTKSKLNSTEYKFNLN
jgi:hypothetical protein